MLDSRYVKVPGLREYTLKLRELGEGVVSRGCVIALAPGANLIRDAVRARAPLLQVPDPRRKRATVRNAVQALRVMATEFAATYVIGIRLLANRAISAFKRRTGKGGSENPDDPFYGTILEFGKTPRTQHPFLRPGFQASAEAAVRVSSDRLSQYTDAEIRRLGAQKP